MTTFKPGGRERFAHQRRGLRDIIRNRGVHALLFDPGTGKTATVLDYASLLALKSPTGEARVLVVAPLAAVDTWVEQAEEYVADGVSVWAEVLGGSIRQRAEALAARGGNPLRKRPAAETPPSWLKILKSKGRATCTRCTPEATYRDHDLRRLQRWGQAHVREVHPDYVRRPRKVTEAPRALGHRRSSALLLRPNGGEQVRAAAGPDTLAGPRLVLCSTNLDSFASRAAATPGGSRTMADLMVEAVRRFSPDLVVIDESHRIKGVNSNTSKALARLTDYVKRRVILTGTLMPHSPIDVYAQWRFLRPDAFGPVQSDGSRREATYGHFQGTYVVMGGYMGKEVKGFTNLDKMQDIIAENSSVARKADSLDLPPVTDTEVTVHLSAAEEQAYEAMRKNLAVTVGSQTTMAGNRLAQLMRLRQITSGFLPDPSGGVTQIGDAKASTARSLVYDTLLGEDRIVVFAHFRPEIDLLARTLAPRKGERPTEILTITGDTKDSERRAIRKRFGSKEGTRLVLIAQIKTMSLAVNELVSASHAIFASLPNQRDDIEQARARLDRQGQTRPVTLWTLVVRSSVDTVILQSYRDRTSLEAAMLEHVLESPQK